MKKRSPESRRKQIRDFPGEAPRTIPVAEEVLEIGKRTVQTGFTRIEKRVREREEEIDEPVLKRRVEVDRIPVNRFVDNPPAVRQKDGTMIVPVLEEVLVVEKRLLLKEELHIHTVSERVRNPQKFTLRSEEVEVHRFNFPEEEEKHPQ